MFILAERYKEHTVTIKEYVRVRNVSESTVRRRIAQGALKIKREVPRGRIEIVL